MPSFLAAVVSIVIASVVAQMILALFVAILFMSSFPQAADVIILAVGLCASILLGTFCYRKIYKALRTTK